MIECTNPKRAPTDCLQYHTGLGGQITSFGYNSGSGALTGDQKYNICLRQEPGFCAFDVSETRSGTPDAWDLDDTGSSAKVSTTIKVKSILLFESVHKECQPFFEIFDPSLSLCHPFY